MGIFIFTKKKNDLDFDMTTPEGTVPTHKSNSDSWTKTIGDKPFCRICQGSSSSINQLISPCNCKENNMIQPTTYQLLPSGTLAYVHFTCLERWLNSSSRISCELCHYQYDTQQTRRYTMWQSLRLWLRHPVNWRHLQADLFILVLLSIVTVVLVLICVLSLEYFIVEGKKYGVSQVWTKGALNVFLTIIIVGYTGSMVFLIKEQLMPWYYWWRNTHNIRLLINSNMATIETRKKLFNELAQPRFDSVENLVIDGADDRSLGKQRNLRADILKKIDDPKTWDKSDKDNENANTECGIKPTSTLKIRPREPHARNIIFPKILWRKRARESFPGDLERRVTWRQLPVAIFVPPPPLVKMKMVSTMVKLISQLKKTKKKRRKRKRSNNETEAFEE